MKKPLFVEIIGETTTGKTTLASKFPRPLFIDTTPSRESFPIFESVVGKEEALKRYRHVESLEEIRKAIQTATDTATVVIDTSTDLQKLALKEWLKENPDRKRPLPVEYGEIRRKIDDLIYDVIGKRMLNLVFTSQMTDEYDAEGKKTGRRIRDGYVKAPDMAGIRLLLKFEQDKNGALKRVCKVIKNRYRDITNPNEYIEYLDDLSWAGIKKLASPKIAEGEFVE